MIVSFVNIVCGCEKLAYEKFTGVMNCKNFMQGKDMKEYYKKMKGRK